MRVLSTELRAYVYLHTELRASAVDMNFIDDNHNLSNSRLWGVMVGQMIVPMPHPMHTPICTSIPL